MSRTGSRWICLLLCSLTVTFAGCGGAKSRNLSKAPVSGEVTFDGKHLPEGQITFIHETGEMESVLFKDDGKFKALVAEGKNEVLVKSAEVSGGAAGGDGGNRAASMEIHKSRIPEKYMMPGQSGLTVTVKSGENTYNVELKSK